MKKIKNKKRALIISALALLVCVSMLVGSTFAWFTDNVTSGRNKIVSGNLDVVLEYKTDWDDNWTAVDENTKIFKEDALYEPGYTEVAYLRVSNAGSLALKYNLMLNIASEKSSTNVNGSEFKLSDYLQIGTYYQDEYSSGANYANILMPFMFGTRETALSNVSLAKLSEANCLVASDVPVLAGEQTAQVMAIVLTMPETVGNEANYDATVATAPEIDLGISLLATQYTYESDSFDNQYDANAEYPIVDADGLAGALADGKEVKLEADVTLSETIVVADDVKIDLNGYDLDASAVDSAFTVATGTDATITIEGADEEVKLGQNGLVDVAAGADAVIEINGGNYVSDDAASTLVKPDGDGKIKIVLNDVNYKSTATNGYALDCSYYDGSDLSVEINGGSFEATTGLLLPEGSSVKDATITANNTKNMQPAVYAMGDMTIENCIIKAEKSHAVAVAGGATLTVNNCEVYAGSDANALAFQVFSSGGTINVNNTTYTGKYGTTGKMSAGCVAIINIDGVEVYRKG